MISVWTSRNPLEHERKLTSHAWVQGTTLAQVLPDWARQPEVRVTRDGVEVPREEWDLPIPDGCRIDVVQSPGFIAAALGITNVVLAGVVNLAASFALSWAVSTILAPRQKPTKEGEDDSGTYGFSGIRSIDQSEGAAVPVVYGQHRAAGVVVNRFVRISATGSELYTLLMLSEGPVFDLGGETADNPTALTSESGTLPEGLLINGQPAADFDFVEAHVRMGDNDQQPIPGFASAEQTFEVGIELEQSITPGPGSVEIAPQSGGYDPGDSGDLAILNQWDTLESYSMTDEADEFGVILEFPSGLYSVNGGGVGPETAQLQVRYRELDGGGSPTGNYVVLPVEPDIIAAQTSPYRVEVRHEFFDPSTYVVPGAGERLDLDGTGDYASISSASGIPAQAPNSTQFGLTVWLLCDDLVWPTTNTANQYLIAQQRSTNEGWRLVLELRRQSNLYTLGAFVTYGDGTQDLDSTFTLLSQFTSPPDVTGWHHLAFTFETFTNGTMLQRVAWDSVVSQSAPAYSCQTDPGADIEIGGAATLPGSLIAFDGAMDVYKQFSKLLLSAEIADDYNGGLGRPGSPQQDLNVALNFDLENTGTTPDASGNGNTATLQGDASISSGSVGLVASPGGGTPKRGKYRIEVQRIDAESTGLNQDEMQWDSVRLTTFEDFTYPGRALLGVRVRSDGEVGQGEPDISVDVRGVRCPVWDGVSSTTPNAPLVWTRNPAWVVLDMLTNPLYGLDKPFELTEIDLPAWKDWADYCDEIVGAARKVVNGALIWFDQSAQQIVIEFEDPDGVPDRWAVGEPLIVSGCDSETTLNSPAGVGYVIESIVSVPTIDGGGDPTVGVAIRCAFPQGQTEPPDGSSNGDTTGTNATELGEARFVADVIFDRRDADAWQGVVELMKSARATPIQAGSKLSVFVDKPALPVATVNMTNIVEGSFTLSWISQNDRPNSVSAEILDRDDSYQRALIEREHPDVTDPTKFSSFRRRRYSLEGVTRQSQALRHLVYELNVHHLVRRQAQFEMPIDGLQLRVGDVVRVAHDMPGWSPSGLFRDGSTASTLRLDRPVTIPSGDFELLWIKRGAGETVTITDSTPSGAYAAGADITLGTALTDGVPAKGDTWVLTASVPFREYRIIGAETDAQTLRRRFTAIEYNASVYDDGFGQLLDQPSSLPVPGSSTAEQSPAPPPVQQLQVSTYSHESEDGSTTAQIELAWRPNDQLGRTVVERHEIWLFRRGSLHPRSGMKLAEVGGNVYRHVLPLSGLDSSDDYFFVVRPVGVNGARSRLTSQRLASYTPPARTAARRSSGSTWPTDPRAGDRFYDTTTEEWYFWDETRGKWLGETLISLDFAQSATFTAGTGLRISGVVTSSTYGHRLPYAAVVVAGAMSTANTVSSAIAGIYQASTFLGFLRWTSSANHTSADDFDWEVPANSPINVLSGATVAGGVTVNLYLRREGNV